MAIARSVPASDKLKKLVELILQLHGPGHRGETVRSYPISSRFQAWIRR